MNISTKNLYFLKTLLKILVDNTIFYCHLVNKGIQEFIVCLFQMIEQNLL